jgi:hypothetical protein
VHALPFATLQSVLAAASGAMTFNSQALSAIGDLTSTAHVAHTDAIGTTKTRGLTARNASAATAIVTRQFSGAVSRKGAAWVSGASRAMEALDELEPVTNGNVNWVFYYDSGGGGGLSEAFRYTTSTSGSFTAALQSYSVGATYAVFLDPTYSGLFHYGGDNGMHVKNRQGKAVWQSDEDLEIRTGGANARAYFDDLGELLSITVLETRVKQITSPDATRSFSATPTFDFDDGLVARMTLTGNVTNLSAANVRDNSLCVLVLTQDATGGRTAVFNPSHFEDATALGAALGATALTRTAYFFVGTGGKLTPIAIRANIVVS